MNWEEKLNKFLEEFEYKDDVIGVLVCGSYITSSPSSHSDLDVHIILDDSVSYRERGNRIIDGLLIEYFANPPKQIRKYFEEDYLKIRPMSQTQFITGKIMMDKFLVVQELKEEAFRMLERKYSDLDISINELQKYELWDMLDDLEDAFENDRVDFDFLYFNFLDEVLSIYMKYIRHPYNKKTILGNITSDVVRKKYLLEELPDKYVGELIFNSITLVNKEERLNNYKKLTNVIFDLVGGFNIDGFKFKSISK